MAIVWQTDMWTTETLGKPSACQESGALQTQLWARAVSAESTRTKGELGIHEPHGERLITFG